MRTICLSLFCCGLVWSNWDHILRGHCIGTGQSHDSPKGSGTAFNDMGKGVDERLYHNRRKLNHNKAMRFMGYAACILAKQPLKLQHRCVITPDLLCRYGYLYMLESQRWIGWSLIEIEDPGFTVNHFYLSIYCIDRKPSAIRSHGIWHCNGGRVK